MTLRVETSTNGNMQCRYIPASASISAMDVVRCYGAAVEFCCLM